MLSQRTAHFQTNHVPTNHVNGPNTVALDSGGSLYIVDNGNQRVRKVSKGIITTIAGNGAPGFSGDDGPAVPRV